MSLVNQITQNCPHCQSSQEIDYYRTVNITLDTHLKEAVLNGKLNTHRCTNCGKEINIVGDLLYHDMEQKIMLHLKEDLNTEELENFEMLKDLKGKGYIYRHIKSYPELIEKIKIFDTQLNDEVIATIKAELSITLKESLQEVVNDIENPEIPIFFDKYEKSIFKKRLIFVFFLDASQLMLLRYDVHKLSKPDRKLLFNMEILRSNT